VGVEGEGGRVTHIPARPLNLFIVVIALLAEPGGREKLNNVALQHATTTVPCATLPVSRGPCALVRLPRVCRSTLGQRFLWLSNG
jgi:hypothetical protein